MIITWDHAKRLANLDKHGLDFAELDLDFFFNSLIVPARKRRWRPGLMIAVVFAPLGSEAISVVSMRFASRSERSMLHGH
jgi:uncharacterized protein